MDFTMKQRYQISLAQCSHIENPTFSQLRAICPHLTELQVAQLYRATGRQQFALPPLRVRGLLQLGEYRNTPRDHWLKINPRCRPITPKTSIPYQTEAVAFAAHHWPSEYTEPSWVTAMTVRIANPLQLGANQKPTTIDEIYLGLTATWQQLLKGNRTLKVKVKRWNEAINVITTDPFEASELNEKAQDVETVYNCSNCGGGLLRTACSGCSYPYKAIDSSWTAPLAPKLVSFLESHGHRFALSPSRLYVA